MKSLIKAAAASVLLCVAGWAAAAEPVALSDNQMDSVAAGTYLHSGSGGSAFALLGLAGTGTTTSATTVGYFSRTSSSTVSLAVGVVAYASSGGGSTIAR